MSYRGICQTGYQISTLFKTLTPDSQQGAVQLVTEPGGLLKHLGQKQVMGYSDIPLFPIYTADPQPEWFVVEIVERMFPPQV